MQRIGLLLKIKPDKLQDYLEIHKNVWPELLTELKKAGMRNYSLWLAPGGLEFGYLECDDWQKVCEYLAGSKVHDKWQEYMQNYLDSPTDEGQGGQPVQLLEMTFLME